MKALLRPTVDPIIERREQHGGNGCGHGSRYLPNARSQISRAEGLNERLASGEGRDICCGQNGIRRRSADDRLGIVQSVAKERHQESERNQDDAELEKGFKGNGGTQKSGARTSGKNEADARDQTQRNPLQLLLLGLILGASEALDQGGNGCQHAKDR